MEIGTGVVVATVIYCAVHVYLQWRVGKDWEKARAGADLESRVAELERIING